MAKILSLTIKNRTYTVGDFVNDEKVEEINLFVSNELSYVSLIGKKHPILIIKGVPQEIAYKEMGAEVVA